MRLKLLPCQLSDAEAMTSVFFEAFVPQDPFFSVIYPHGPTPKAFAHFKNRVIDSFKDPCSSMMKVVDPSITPDGKGSEMVAWARWIFWRSKLRPAQWDVPYEEAVYHGVPNEFGKDAPDVDDVFYAAFWTELLNSRRLNYPGGSCICLHWLATRPRHGRRGAGCTLLNWGIDQADLLGLEIYAEASPMILASGTAGSFGFHAVDSFTINLEKLGKQQSAKCKWPARKTLMIRPPFIPYEERQPMYM